MRTIKVIDPQNGLTYEFNGEFNTLGDLLDVMDNEGINYENIRMVEGYSKSSFNVNNRDAVIPKEVVLRGTTYTNLIFSMMQENKKISSATDRKKLMAEAKKIIENNPNLKKEVSNISQVKTEILAGFVLKYGKSNCCNNTTNSYSVNLNDWANSAENRLAAIEKELGIKVEVKTNSTSCTSGISEEDRKLFRGMF